MWNRLYLRDWEWKTPCVWRWEGWLNIKGLMMSSLDHITTTKYNWLNTSVENKQEKKSYTIFVVWLITWNTDPYIFDQKSPLITVTCTSTSMLTRYYNCDIHPVPPPPLPYMLACTINSVSIHSPYQLSNRSYIVIAKILSVWQGKPTKHHLYMACS